MSNRVLWNSRRITVASTGTELVAVSIQVRCSDHWAMKQYGSWSGFIWFELHPVIWMCMKWDINQYIDRYISLVWLVRGGRGRHRAGGDHLGRHCVHRQLLCHGAGPGRHHPHPDRLLERWGGSRTGGNMPSRGWAGLYSDTNSCATVLAHKGVIQTPIDFLNG